MQAALVLVPRRPARRGRFGPVGLVAPAVALGIGIGVLRVFAGGPHALALLAAVATPALAAARPRRAPLTATLWLVAWLAHGLLAQAASVGLIALAAVTIAELAAVLAPAWSIAVGLVVLAVVDVALVWGTAEVQPATTALHHAAVASAAGHPIPRLQDATFGGATMGWLDLVAPALLGVVARARVRAALVTGVAAGVWGLLLYVTSTVPATVPALAGLLAGGVAAQGLRRRGNHHLAMRRFAPFLVLAALLGGCGSTAAPPPKQPRLPRALAHSWARQADAVAAALAAGDGCTAQTRANALQQQVIAAVNARRVPQRLLEPLSSGLNDLTERISCVPAPTPQPEPEHEKHGHGPKEHKHGKHGEGD